MNKNSLFSIWFTTARPKTLPLALASIIVGSALAHWAGKFDVVTTLLAFITTILLQILSNFANDYGDHVKGSDTKERIGPLRAIQHGVIGGEQLKKAVIILSLLSFVSGVALSAYAFETVQDSVFLYRAWHRLNYCRHYLHRRQKSLRLFGAGRSICADFLWLCSGNRRVLLAGS